MINGKKQPRFACGVLSSFECTRETGGGRKKMPAIVLVPFERGYRGNRAIIKTLNLTGGREKESSKGRGSFLIESLLPPKIAAPVKKGATLNSRLVLRAIRSG